MAKKIIIPKKILENLYLKKKLSTYEIAKKFNCDPSVIQKRLREYTINLRNPKGKIKVSKDKLFSLYVDKGLSTQKISKLLGISSCTVYNKLKELNIKPRSKKIVYISKEKLKELYYDKKFPLSKIAKLYDCSTSIIFDKMKKYELKRRDLFESNTIFPKKRFEDDLIKKAYMIGFRLGDLHVKKDSKNSSILKITSNTTKLDQVNLIKEIYGIYGHFWVKNYGGVYNISIQMDKSFKFLFSKKDNIPAWILKNNKQFFAFLGGYTDAEGNIGISQNRARFRIRSYDKNILFQIYNKLNFLKINAKFNLVSKKGIYGERKYNKDCWGVFVNEKDSLLKLFNFLKSYIKHEKRYNDLIMAEQNILERNKKYGNEIRFMKDKKTFYITTTIPYANAPPHIGFALEIIQADVLARWHKQRDEDVFFLTGTDEHGVKNYQEAKKQNLNPQKFVDKNSTYFRKLTKVLNISNNYFIRTTDKKMHWPGVLEIWKKLEKNKDIYKKKYEGYYCLGCERFITKKELIEGKCPNHPNLDIQYISEENYFFKLSKYSNKIKKLIETDKIKISPKKWKNDFLSLIEKGLTDVSFSRDKIHLPWGIPVPNDESQVMYVWPDALTNYLTGIGFPDKKYKNFWPVDVHVVGKDMLRFHTGIWPGMLLSAGIELPKEVIVHGFLTVGGKKMSKSLGNVVAPLELIKKYPSDSIRYSLMRATPFGDDGDFSEQALINRHNNELANKLGNLVSRVEGLIEKNGITETENQIHLEERLKRAIEKGEAELSSNEEGHLCISRRYRGARKGRVSGVRKTQFLSEHPLSWLEPISLFVEKQMEDYQFDKALSIIFAFVDHCNWYIQVRKLWETKDKKALYELKESILKIAELLWPFIPESADKIKKQFSAKKITKGEILFKKI